MNAMCKRFVNDWKIGQGIISDGTGVERVVNVVGANIVVT
jgi:hypothetical protein